VTKKVFGDAQSSECERMVVVDWDGDRFIDDTLESKASIYPAMQSANILRMDPAHEHLVFKPRVEDALNTLLDAQVQANDVWPQQYDITGFTMTDHTGAGHVTNIGPYCTVEFFEQKDRSIPCGSKKIPASARPALDAYLNAQKEAALLVGQQLFDDVYSKMNR
jgi:hypothetical protein